MVRRRCMDGIPLSRGNREGKGYTHSGGEAGRGGGMGGGRGGMDEVRYMRMGGRSEGGRGNLCAARHVATKTVGAGIDGPSAGKGGCCDVCPNYRIAVKGQIPAAGMVGGAGARRAFVATWRLCEVCRRKSPFYQFSRLAIAPLVGEVPSAASALPNQQCGAPP